MIFYVGICKLYIIICYFLLGLWSFQWKNVLVNYCYDSQNSAGEVEESEALARGCGRSCLYLLQPQSAAHTLTVAAAPLPCCHLTVNAAYCAESRTVSESNQSQHVGLPHRPRDDVLNTQCADEICKPPEHELSVNEGRDHYQSWWCLSVKYERLEVDDCHRDGKRELVVSICTSVLVVGNLKASSSTTALHN